MKRVINQATIILALILVCTTLSCANVTATGPLATPAYPFPQHVSYAPGTILPNHRTQAQLDDDVRAAYAYWKSSYLVEMAGDPPRYRIEHSPNRTVSEAQGYGMIIVAIMAGHDPDAQPIFDGLWRFVRDHPSNIDNRLMAWQFPEGPGGEDSAFDGDADIAYALLLADAQWGSAGEVAYQAEAQTVITAILESTIGPESRLPLLGDWVDPNGAPYNQYTPRSSDFMSGHFRAFGRSSNDPVWSTVVTNIQRVITSLQNHHSPTTGLLPDFIQPVSNGDRTPRPAAAGFLEGANDGHYYYNAGRDPWRIGSDALLNNDPTSLAQVRRMADWIATATGQDPANIKAGYLLDGTPLPSGNYFTSFFVAPFGVALMTRPTQQAFLNDLYNAVYQRYEAYYEDSVTLLTLLVMTGNFWDPTLVTQAKTPLFLPLVRSTPALP
jgi:endo-1,4-beta-D-glucanase Y